MAASELYNVTSAILLAWEGTLVVQVLAMPDAYYSLAWCLTIAFYRKIRWPQVRATLTRLQLTCCWERSQLDSTK